jgi:hypothetical protein
MQQKMIIKTALTRQTTDITLTFNMTDIDRLFPGFKAGDFAVIYGSQSVTSILSNLCIRAQLSRQLGGLDTKVIFIDSANSSSLSNILHAARIQQLDPKTAIENIISKRTYTAYRLTSLIMEELEKVVEASDAKVVVISDIACSFLSDNVDDQEAKAVYSQIMGYLTSFAKRHRIIIIATHLSHESNRRNSTLQDLERSKANTIIRFTRTPYTSEVELEKHPSYMLGVAEFTPEVRRIGDYC